MFWNRALALATAAATLISCAPKLEKPDPWASDYHPVRTGGTREKPTYENLPSRRKHVQPLGARQSLDDTFVALELRCAAAEIELQDGQWGDQWIHWSLFVVGTASTIVATAVNAANSQHASNYVETRNTALVFGGVGSLMTTISGAALLNQRANASASTLEKVRATLDGARAQWPFARSTPTDAIKVLKGMADGCALTPAPEIITAERVVEMEARRSALVAIKNIATELAADGAPTSEQLAFAEAQLGEFSRYSVGAASLETARNRALSVVKNQKAVMAAAPASKEAAGDKANRQNAFKLLLLAVDQELAAYPASPPSQSKAPEEPAAPSGNEAGSKGNAPGAGTQDSKKQEPGDKPPAPKGKEAAPATLPPAAEEELPPPPKP